MESPVENQFLLGERAGVVPIFLLGCLCACAFHQKNTHRQTHFRVSDGGDTAVSRTELLALDTGKSFAHEPE